MRFCDRFNTAIMRNCAHRSLAVAEQLLPTMKAQPSGDVCGTKSQSLHHWTLISKETPSLNGTTLCFTDNLLSPRTTVSTATHCPSKINFCCKSSNWSRNGSDAVEVMFQIVPSIRNNVLLGTTSADVSVCKYIVSSVCMLVLVVSVVVNTSQDQDHVQQRSQH